MNSFTSRRCFLVAVLALMTLKPGEGQTKNESAASLIRALAGQRVDIASAQTPGTSCLAFKDLAERQRPRAESLVRLGTSALPDIESALDSLENQGERSEVYPGANWLFFAYAKIKGPAALPRLHGLLGNHRLRGSGQAISMAVSLALGLTSYVPSSLRPVALSCGPEEPRDTLDQLILAWETGDRNRFEAILGPRATASFRSLGSWDGARAELWHHPRGALVAMGYRFAGSSPYSEPQVTFEGSAARDVPLRPSGNPIMETSFVNGTGYAYGVLRLDFQGTTEFAKYQIENDDISGLLRLIDLCATPVVGISRR
jgi:hypothetical protein